MSSNLYGKYVSHGVIAYHLFITNLRGGGGGHQNSSKGMAYSDRAKMTSELLFTGNWV